MIPVIEDNADYMKDLGYLSGKNAKKHPEVILDYLKEKRIKTVNVGLLRLLHISTDIPLVGGVRPNWCGRLQMSGTLRWISHRKLKVQS